MSTSAYAVETAGESLILCTRPQCHTSATSVNGEAGAVALDQEALDDLARNTRESVTCDRCGALLAEPHGEPDPPPTRRKGR